MDQTAQTYAVEDRERVAALLERLADGEDVVLGDFSDNASPGTEADVEAEILREIVQGLRA